MVATRPSLKLSQKALILVSVPLLFEIVFAVILLEMVQNSEQETKRAERSRMVIVYSDNLVRRLYEIGMATLAQNTIGGKFFVDEYNRAAGMVKQDLQNLRRMVSDDSEQKKTAEAIKKTVDEILSSLERGRAELDVDNQDFPLRAQGYNYRAELEPLLRELVPQVQALTAREKQLRKDNHGSEQSARNMVRIAVVVGIIMNVVVALGLAVYFNRSTTRRLLLVIDNSKRLAEGKPLNKLMQGNDEIGQVDKTFHDMANALEESAEKERTMMKVKQEFMHMVSHDLGTPLTSINFFFSLLLSDAFGKISDECARSAEGAAEAGKRLIALVNDLLDLEKASTGSLPMKLAECSVDEILKNSLRSVKGFAEEKKVNVSVCPETNILFVADKDRLIQVVVNLASNAIKFSPEGGTVTLEGSATQDYVELRVRDQGKGIPEELRQVIFERFKQVENSDATEKGGRGLGLAICKSIVESHGGTIGVDSEIGKGSTFWCRLPVRTTG